MSALCCPVCSRQFGDANALRNHHNAKHKKHPPIPKAPKVEAEQSMADIAIIATTSGKIVSC